MKESIKVLNEAIEVQTKKAADYQNPRSSIKQADHYPNGCMTILDMVHQKLTRIRSLMESGADPQFEKLEDSAIDAINYLSFFVEYSRGKMDGQDKNRDYMNKPKKITPTPIETKEIDEWPFYGARSIRQLPDSKLQEYYRDLSKENKNWGYTITTPARIMLQRLEVNLLRFIMMKNQ
jgi:hypothetical protein